jgi:hypothetical protein
MASEFIGQLTSRAISPFLKRYALSFLHEKNIQRKQEQLLRKKFRKIQYTSIGKKIGVQLNSSVERLPLTSYEFYKQYFDHPNEGDMMFPIDDYVKAMTSGSMGKPKTYLLPKTGIWDNLMKTGLSIMFLATHDGEKITFEFGDTVYRNIPGGSYISGFLADTFQDRRSNWVKQVPKLDLNYHEKVDYFVTNYQNIDVAYMTVTSLLDDIYPKIGRPFKLKGLITQDRSASVFKEKIKEVAGTYPKVTYGSTETFLSGLSSIEFPGCFFLDWRIMFCEFIPEEKAVDIGDAFLEEPPETISLMEVEAGKKYQLITTPFKNDMTRYITPDIFECVSNGDSVLGTELPIFSFYTRKDKLITLHNFTRISEEELLQVLQDAEIPYTDFTTEVELSGAKEYLTIYIELSTHMEVSEVTQRINDELLKVDKDWRDLTSFMRYTPLKVHLLPNGAFSRYLGKKDGLPRIERIGMRDERLKVLLNST